MKKLLIILLVCCTCTQCDSDEPSSSPTPEISSFTPTSGILGTSVTITGNNFDPDPAKNEVEFNGEPADVTAASETELTVTVPETATTGKISVTVDNETGISVSDFTVPVPTITTFEPAMGAPGLPGVLITGTNFSTVANQNVVKFNNVNATVTAASATQLTATVGAATTTGKVSVAVGANSATSTDDFVICSNAELVATITFTNISPGTSCSYTYTIRNIGASPLDLTKFTLQAYISQDAVFGAGDQAGGGTQLDAGGTLDTGETYTESWSSNGDVVNTYQYLIVDFFDDTATVTECNTANNQVIKHIQL